MMTEAERKAKEAADKAALAAKAGGPTDANKSIAQTKEEPVPGGVKEAPNTTKSDGSEPGTQTGEEGAKKNDAVILNEILDKVTAIFEMIKEVKDMEQAEADGGAGAPPSPPPPPDASKCSNGNGTVNPGDIAKSVATEVAKAMRPLTDMIAKSVETTRAVFTTKAEPSTPQSDAGTRKDLLMKAQTAFQEGRITGSEMVYVENNFLRTNWYPSTDLAKKLGITSAGTGK